MRTVIYSFNQESAGAKSLAEALNIKRVRHENSKFVGRKDDQLINWGCGSKAWDVPGNIFPGRVINDFTMVNICGDKARFFSNISQVNPEVSLAPWTVCQEDAIKWWRDGEVVVARQILRGHSGEGIKIFENGLDFVYAPLYTIYVPKKAEFRIHIVADEVIDFQQKIRDPEREPVDWRVRSHQNGFIYVRNDVNPPEQVLNEAKKAMAAAKLDFGAVDCIWNERRQKAYVLEINTSPGLEGQTVKSYAEAFRKNYHI